MGEYYCVNSFCFESNFYPGAVDPIYFINTNVYSKVQRDKALHKNELFEQCTVTCAVYCRRGHRAYGLGDFKED